MQKNCLNYENFSPRDIMEYEIVDVDEFAVMGKEYRLYNTLEKNMRLAQKHWMNFNNTLRRNKVYLGQNWLKYAFVIEKNNALYYFISVPEKDSIPEGLSLKTIPKSKYLVVNHTGNMNKLKNTVDSVYNDLISKNDFSLNSEVFSYFERYDNRFHWNRKDSVIEIYFPIL